MSRKALGFDDSGSEEEIEETQPTGRRPNQRTNKDIIAQSLRNQTKSKQYEEDNPDIYQYDEVYDEIEANRELKKPKIQDSDEGPKYITKLLEAKKKRNLDKLYVQDLKIQKERDLEGDEYKDKETFVTSAYKEFQQERQKERESDEISSHNNDQFRQNIVQNYEDFNENETSNNPHSSFKAGLNRGLNKPVITPGINTRPTIPVQSTQTKVQDNKVSKSKLLPKLSDDIIKQYKERYLERKAKEA